MSSAEDSPPSPTAAHPMSSTAYPVNESTTWRGSSPSSATTTPPNKPDANAKNSRAGKARVQFPAQARCETGVPTRVPLRLTLPRFSMRASTCGSPWSATPLAIGAPRTRDVGTGALWWHRESLCISRVVIVRSLAGRRVARRAEHGRESRIHLGRG